MNAWRTKADVLKDLGEVNGRRTGAEHLDQHVVAGERPPPIHHEIPDENEMSYFFGGRKASVAEDSAGPDLAGISTMLKIVSDMEETVDNNEPRTLYRNKLTDEISISKLNPHAGEYVPGSNNHIKRNVPKNNYGSRSNKMAADENIGSHSIANEDTRQNSITTHMFKTRSEHLQERNMNGIADENVNNKTNATLNGSKQNGFPFNNTSPMFKSKCVKDEQERENIKNAQSVPESKQEPVNTPKLANGLPKRKIESDLPEAEHIKELQNKIKSTIIASSTDKSLQTKRQKNVAIATLLKLGMAHEKPVKLIKPNYFEKPPTNEDNEIIVDNEQPSTSSSESNLNGIDQESITKVDSWFNSIETPKQKQPFQEKLVLKECVTFKKKTTSNATSNSISSNDKEKESPKNLKKSFTPSSYASQLLKKYESNAQRQAPITEDLGTRLERQLKERDELIKQKMLARQNAS